MNCKAKNGLTPLHLCAQEDRVEVAKLLVSFKRRKSRLIEGNVMGLCGRLLSVWVPEPHIPPPLHTVNVYSVYDVRYWLIYNDHLEICNSIKEAFRNKNKSKMTKLVAVRIAIAPIVSDTVIMATSVSSSLTFVLCVWQMEALLILAQCRAGCSIPFQQLHKTFFAGS